MATRFERAWRSPRAALRAWLSPGAVITLLEEDVTRAVAQLHQQARALEVHLADTVRPVRLSKDETFRFFRRLVNYDPAIAEAASLTYDAHLDFFVADSSHGVLSHASRGRRNARQGAHDAGAAEHDVRARARGPLHRARRVHRVPRVATPWERSRAARSPDTSPASPQPAGLDGELPQLGDATGRDARGRERRRRRPPARGRADGARGRRPFLWRMFADPRAARARRPRAGPRGGRGPQDAGRPRRQLSSRDL